LVAGVLVEGDPEGADPVVVDVDREWPPPPVHPTTPALMKAANTVVAASLEPNLRCLTYSTVLTSRLADQSRRSPPEDQAGAIIEHISRRAQSTSSLPHEESLRPNPGHSPLGHSTEILT
jgi:hypothetical protein